jgi:hypothetical protein
LRWADVALGFCPQSAPGKPDGRSAEQEPLCRHALARQGSQEQHNGEDVAAAAPVSRGRVEQMVNVTVSAKQELCQCEFAAQNVEKA